MKLADWVSAKGVLAVAGSTPRGRTQHHGAEWLGFNAV